MQPWPPKESSAVETAVRAWGRTRQRVANGSPTVRIVWGDHQEEHFGSRMSREEFGHVWLTKTDVGPEPPDARWGPCTRSHGFLPDQTLVEFIWRYQDQDPRQGVFPITAYFTGPPSMEDVLGELRPGPEAEGLPEKPGRKRQQRRGGRPRRARGDR